MGEAILTDDGRSAVSAIVLANLIGCARDQIRVWRRDEGAPDSLDLIAWRDWLRDRRKWSFLATLEQIMGAVPGNVDPAALPEKTAAPAKEGAGGDDGKDGTATTEDWERRERRARALRAERELAEADGRLVNRALVEQVAARLAGLVVQRLSAGIWSSLNPALDGCPPDARKAVREAHDRAMLAMRADLRVAGPAVLAELLPRAAEPPPP